MPSGEVVANTDGRPFPFKVILYDDDGSVIGETYAGTEEEGLAFIADALTAAPEADVGSEAEPGDAPPRPDAP